MIVNRMSQSEIRMRRRDLSESFRSWLSVLLRDLEGHCCDLLIVRRSERSVSFLPNLRLRFQYLQQSLVTCSPRFGQLSSSILDPSTSTIWQNKCMVVNNVLDHQESERMKEPERNIHMPKMQERRSSSTRCSAYFSSFPTAPGAYSSCPAG